jgi:hypothetical protein
MAATAGFPGHPAARATTCRRAVPATAPTPAEPPPRVAPPVPGGPTLLKCRVLLLEPLALTTVVSNDIRTTDLTQHTDLDGSFIASFVASAQRRRCCCQGVQRKPPLRSTALGPVQAR